MSTTTTFGLAPGFGPLIVGFSLIPSGVGVMMFVCGESGDVTISTICSSLEFGETSTSTGVVAAVSVGGYSTGLIGVTLT